MGHPRRVAAGDTALPGATAPSGRLGVLGAGTVAGVGFTISLLVATLAFDGARLEEAKVGILAAAGGASALTWLVFGATAAT